MGEKKIKTSKIDYFFKGLLLIVVLVVSVLITFETYYWNKVYPGIRVAQFEVGGKSVSEVEKFLQSKAVSMGLLSFRWGVNQWQFAADEIGVKYDNLKTTQDLMAMGRSGSFRNDLVTKARALINGINLNPKAGWNGAALSEKLSVLALMIDIPAREPGVEFSSTGSGVLVHAGEDGLMVDQKTLRTRIETSIQTFSEKEIAVPIVEIKPKLSENQAERARVMAEKIRGKKIQVNEEQGELKLEISDEQVLSWIDLSSGGWEKSAIEDWVAQLAQTVDKPPQNATFRFLGTGKVEEFKPAKEGRVLKRATLATLMINSLNRLLGQSEPVVVDLEFTKSEPEVVNDEVNSLGIKELLGKGESWYSGSITNRIFNLKKAADAIGGFLVPPGETFSFNGAVGEVSSDTGYKQAYIIKEGKTILGDGGGVCQVSSTLFRAVLAAGLPIEARTAHAYRVHYYEEKYQPGFDATVFQPAPDFKFKNDTPAYVLIQTVYDEKAKYLSFEIYGTSDGRKAEMSKARIWEVTAPPPDLYQDDPNLPVGKVVQTEHAAWGAKVAFDWKVTRGEEVLQERTFYSNYKSWQAVYLRGTKPL